MFSCAQRLASAMLVTRLPPAVSKRNAAVVGEAPAADDRDRLRSACVEALEELAREPALPDPGWAHEGHEARLGLLPRSTHM